MKLCSASTIFLDLPDFPFAKFVLATFSDLKGMEIVSLNQKMSMQDQRDGKKRLQFQSLNISQFFQEIANIPH